MEYIRVVVTFIFGIGLFINSILFIPQALKLYKTKNSEDLSAITFVGFCIIQASGIAYSYFNQAWVLLFGNSCSLVTTGIVTALIFYYRRPQ